MACVSPLGIQLGTTHFASAVYRDGRVVPIEGPEGLIGIPSIVGVLDDGRVVVGKEAQELLETRPERVLTDFLRWLGRDYDLELVGHELEASLLVSLLLAHIKAEAETFLEQPIDDCVLSVPSRFDERQRRAILRSASLAGLDVIRLVEEPLAAAWSHWTQRPSAGFSIVLDLGGRTFDVSVIENTPRESRLIAVDGDDGLGGEAFTDRILDWVLQREGMRLELAELHEPHYVARLRAVVEEAKRVLCEPETEAVRIVYPERDGRLSGEETECTIDGARFETLTQHLADRLRAPIQRALEEASLGSLEVDEVILVGGASPMPVVQKLVRSVLGADVSMPLEPRISVVRGAAIQAALLTGALPRSAQVTTRTIGVEITRQIGDQTVGGYFLPMVPRGTPLPLTLDEEVETAHDGQVEVFLRFYIGESSRVAHNDLLGEVVLGRFDPAPAGQKLQIRMRLEPGGCIAIVVGTEGLEEPVRAVFHAEGAQLTEEQREDALAVLEASAEARYEDYDQHLVHYAEQTLTLLSVRERWWLEQVLDAYRESLANGPVLTAQLVRSDLMALLDQLGYAYQDGQGSLSVDPSQWRILRPDHPEEGAA